jgi:hypothetical protein
VADSSWLAPAMGLAGTLAVASLGYYQWRRSNRQRRDAEFFARRAETLETLVRKLQNVQLLSRTRTVAYSDIRDQTRPLNEFLIENRLWLEPEDEHLARQYLDALLAIHLAMATSDAADLDVYVATAAGPYSDGVADEFRELARVNIHVSEAA